MMKTKKKPKKYKVHPKDTPTGIEGLGAIYVNRIAKNRGLFVLPELKTVFDSMAWLWSIHDTTTGKLVATYLPFSRKLMLSGRDGYSHMSHWKKALREAGRAIAKQV